MIALSIRQPWAWAIMRAGKDIENRDWMTEYRGRILVHASKGGTKKDYEFARGYIQERTSLVVPDKKEIVVGAILGAVTVVDCVDGSDSAWFMGPQGFVLKDPYELPEPVYCKGKLKFFGVSREVADALKQQAKGRGSR